MAILRNPNTGDNEYYDDDVCPDCNNSGYFWNGYEYERCECTYEEEDE